MIDALNAELVAMAVQAEKNQVVPGSLVIRLLLLLGLSNAVRICATMSFFKPPAGCSKPKMAESPGLGAFFI